MNFDLSLPEGQKAFRRLAWVTVQKGIEYLPPFLPREEIFAEIGRIWDDMDHPLLDVSDLQEAERIWRDETRLTLNHQFPREE